MFGYVRPSDRRLTEEERETFRAAYCGLCHALGASYGPAGRMILNYDLTFLAMVLSEGGGTCEKRCAVHPLRPFRRALHRADTAVRLRVDQRFRREDAVYTELTFAVFHHPKLAFQPLAQFGRQRFRAARIAAGAVLDLQLFCPAGNITVVRRCRRGQLVQIPRTPPHDFAAIGHKRFVVGFQQNIPAGGDVIRFQQRIFLRYHA